MNEKVRQMKKEIPQEVKDAALAEAEKLIFPHPAKTLGGKIGRIAFKIFSLIISKKKIDV